MNRLFRTIGLILTAVFAAGTANVLTNGSFESGSTGWYCYVDSANGGYGNCTYVTSSTDAQDGSAFARVTVTKINTAKNWLIQLQDPTWTATSGVEYHLSFYAKADSARKIQVASAGGKAASYKYYTGTEFALTTSWKKIDYYYTSPATGPDSLNFNFYCGYAPGIYDFDNVVIEASLASYPSTITPPSKSAWESGIHRNLFVELGYTQEAVDEKVNSAFQQLFFGNRDEEAVYTEEGTDMGFITKPGSGYILTEGQSYGCMIALQMDRQDIFDRLWKFAYTYMLHHEGARKGMFSWKVTEATPHTMYDPNPAPDGEEYFVTSLLFAAQRWGNKTGMYDYQAQADSILTEMLHKTANDTVVAEINSDHAMILFTPDARSTEPFTDPSYHLPAFYSAWAQLATNDKDFWAKMADTSRAFFQRACHATTGLTADYAAFDGSPYPVSYNRFAGWYHSDAWRVPMNIGMDYSWCKADDWQSTYSKTLMTWLATQTPDYKETYSIDGTIQSESADSLVTYSASTAQVACNAVAALASTDTIAWKYVDRFWKQPTPSGTWRYYGGLLHMLSLLHVSGNFKIYGNPALGVNDFHSANLNLTSTRISGTAQILDIAGRVVAKVDLGKGLSLSSVNSSSLAHLTGFNAQNGVFFIRATGNNNNIVVKRISSVK